MAIIPETQYAGKIAPADAEYPYGKARNITLPGDGTGTPWEAALVNDIFGFQQSLLSESGITPSGDPEAVGASQYLQALKKLLASQIESVSESFAGSNPAAFGSAQVLVLGWRPGAAALADFQGSLWAAAPSLDKSEHNGIDVVSPTVPGASDQPGASAVDREAAFRAGTGETDPGGTGVFVRVGATSGRIQAIWAGLKGDGSDELIALRDLAAYATGTKRGIDFEPNKTYKYSDYVSFFDAGVLDFKESLVVFEHSGNSAGLQLKGQTGVRNSRHQNNGTPSGTLGPAGQRDIVALDVKHTEFRNIKFLSGSNNYAPFNILGNSYDLDVDQIEFEDAQWDMGCICHWATVSDSAATDYSADIAFSPGVGNATTHPHAIRIGNIEGNSWTPAGSLVSLLFLSGCYGVTGANFTAEQINTLITVVAGDYANEFAPVVIASFINTGIKLANFTCHQITGTKGVAVSGAGVLTSNRTKAGVVLINPNLRSTTSGTRYGLFADHCEDTALLGGSITGFSRSIFAQRNVLGLSIEWVTCTAATDGGILSDSDEDPNYGLSIRFCKIYDNNKSAGSSLVNSGISMINTRGATIMGNKFGFPGATEAQQHSVYIQDFCDNITLASNHTYDAAQSAAYSGELVTQFSMKLWDGGGNTSETAFIFRPDTHAWYRPLAFDNVQVLLNQTNSAPNSGSWNQGDEAIFRDPPAGGFRGAICTVGGSPGTWKRYGALEA